MGSINTRLVNDVGEFRALVADWNRLAERTDESSVFLRHEWFDAAYEWWRDEAELVVVGVTRDEELIGICPLMSRRTRYTRLPVTQLEFLSVPDTQECALLAADDDLDDVVRALARFLAESAADWDVLRLDKLREGSTALRSLRSHLDDACCGSRILEGGTNFGIEFADSWQAYYGRRSRRLKKGNNLVVNRLKRDGKAVEIQCFTADPEAEFDKEALLRSLVDLSASSWKAKDGFTLEKPQPGRFIRHLSDHAIRNSWFLAWVLTIDGVPAAMEYQIRYRDTICGLRADYDVSFEDYSPGTLLNWRIIERLFDSGADRYMMGPGSNAYKLRWAETEIRLRGYLGYGRSARGRMLHTVDTVMKPLARRIRGLFRREVN